MTVNVKQYKSDVAKKKKKEGKTLAGNFKGKILRLSCYSREK